MEGTPREHGYRLTACWEKHAASWLTWPQHPQSWPGRERDVCRTYARIIKELSFGEDVNILVNGAAAEAVAHEILDRENVRSPRIHFRHVPTNSEWITDYGPVFLRRDRAEHPLAVADFRFTAYGMKYSEFAEDDAVPRHVAEILGAPCYDADFVFEGGSIDTNGRGLIITTESCLLHFNRNPDLAKEGIEQYLRDYAAAQMILWLTDGITGDETDGHVNDVARFVNEDTIVAMVEEDTTDDNHWPLRHNLARLLRMYDRAGNRLHVSTMPMPEPMYHEGRRLPASYANFYVGNEVVLVPQFGCRQDEVSLRTLENLFPTRRVVGIDASALVTGLGGFHCLITPQPL